MRQLLIFTVAVLVGLSLNSVSASASDISSPSAQIFKKAKGEVKSVVFSIHLHCMNCVKKVQENIAFEKGVKDLKVSLEDQTVSIKYDPAKTSVQTLKTAIESLGYPVKGIVE